MWYQINNHANWDWSTRQLELLTEKHDAASALLATSVIVRETTASYMCLYASTATALLATSISIFLAQTQRQESRTSTREQTASRLVEAAARTPDRKARRSALLAT